MTLAVAALPAPAGEGAAVRYPALETLLARARRGSLPAAGLAGLVDWLGEVRIDPEWSIAAVCRLGEQGGGDVADATWLRADPVHLLPAGDRLLLMQPAGLSTGTAQALVRACNAHFRPEGHRLEAPHPLRWYLRPARELHVTTRAPDAVAGRDILPFVPAGPDAPAAMRLMTEAQMVLHRAAGEDHGQRVNSLWLWGGGRAPGTKPKALPPLWSDEPFARGLWRLTGNAVHPLPATGEEWLAQMVSDGIAVLGGDSRAAGGLGALDRDWCAPLLAAVAAGRVETFSLVAGQQRYALTHRALRRFWRRRRPLVREAPHAD